MKKINSYNRILCAILIMAVSLLGVSCGRKNMEDAKGFKVYYVNSGETGIISKDYTVKSSPADLEGAVDEILELLGQTSEKLEYEAPISGGVKLIGYFINDKLLTLNFDAQYYDLGRTIEVLDRAAIVSTLTQLDGIDYVTFQVDGTPLSDHYGNLIGNMSGDTFIYNAGNEINTYEKIELKLFFANETGDKLVPVYRSVVYNSNISMEKLAAEQIISGPNTDIAFPTISKNTKINSVNVKDGVCYIDFDPEFQNEPYNVSAEVAIYSIVNTVAEFSDVNKVVLSVNGEQSFIFKDFTVSGSYERNLDIVE